MKTTNDLKKTFENHFDGHDVEVEITLNDKCKNGYENFHITGDILYSNGSRISWSCHDEILKFYPEFKEFVLLHGNDFLGAPSYPIANGYYFLKQGFDRIKPTDRGFKEKWCEYMCVPIEMFEKLNAAKNRGHLGMLLQELKAPEIWKKNADKAIKQLEEWTGEKFESQSTRNYWQESQKEIREYQERLGAGYYTEEAVVAREQKAIQEEVDKIKSDYSEAMKKALLDHDVKMAILSAGGTKAFKNCIYHSHINTVKFNWRGYDNLDIEFINEVISKMNLPEEIKIEISNK